MLIKYICIVFSMNLLRQLVIINALFFQCSGSLIFGTDCYIKVFFLVIWTCKEIQNISRPVKNFILPQKFCDISRNSAKYCNFCDTKLSDIPRNKKTRNSVPVRKKYFTQFPEILSTALIRSR
jgi:hypothetical protein